jgi:hypothetical protein
MKAIFMYKIINGHTAPNLKESFDETTKQTILTISETKKLT